MEKAIYIGKGEYDIDGDYYDTIKCPYCGKEQRDYGDYKTGYCNKCDKVMILDYYD